MFLTWVRFWLFGVKFVSNLNKFILNLILNKIRNNVVC